MLRERVTSEAQPRSKKGHPTQSTTGVARTSWIHTETRIGTRWWSAGNTCPPISRTNTGKDRASAIQKRRVMSVSSELEPVAAVTVAGSSAMPQMGHAPG